MIGWSGDWYVPILIAWHGISMIKYYFIIVATKWRGGPDTMIKLLHWDLEVTGSSRENSLSACRGKVVYINFSLDAAMMRALCTGFAFLLPPSLLLLLNSAFVVVGRGTGLVFNPF